MFAARAYQPGAAPHRAAFALAVHAALRLAERAADYLQGYCTLRALRADALVLAIVVHHERPFWLSPQETSVDMGALQRAELAMRQQALLREGLSALQKLWGRRA